MCWFNWLGVGLQVVGLLGAMYLLARLHETVTGRQVIPLRWVRTAWRRPRTLALRLLGRKPPSIQGRAGLFEEGDFMRAHGVTTRGPMPDGLAVDAQVAWVVDYVRAVESEHNDLSSKVWHLANAQEDAVKATRDFAEKEIRQAVNTARSEFRQLVGQDIGREIVSLVAVAIGVVMAALPC
jgi:tetrahydromethanopterin S-methyltransferase subunit G